MNSQHSGVAREIWRFPKGPCGTGQEGHPPCLSTQFTSATIEAARELAQDQSKARIRSGKVVVVGDVGVGKTSLIHRFCRNSFNTDYKATIGVDFEVEAFSILGLPFHLQIWDTAGQERFRSLAAAYYRGADCLVVVFDLSDTESLVSGRKWYEEAQRAIGRTVPVFLVGTKIDCLPSDQMAIFEEARAVGDSIGAEYWNTSSATGEAVSDLFHKMAAVTFETNLNAIPSLAQAMTLDPSDLYEEKRKLCRCII